MVAITPKGSHSPVVIRVSGGGIRRCKPSLPPWEESHDVSRLGGSPFPFTQDFSVVAEKYDQEISRRAGLKTPGAMRAN